MEALEAIKLMVGKGSVVKNKLLVVDLKNMSFDFINVKRNPRCPVCGQLG
jgi:adenylyltransferase/sulfurtransferase